MADWRSDIKHAAMTAMGERKPQPNAIKLMVDFSLPYPQSSVRKYQMGWLPCVKKPDIDKLLRALLDGLTGIVWVDDSQVVCCVVNKAYAWDGSPGAVVTIDYLDDGFLKRLGESRSILLQAMANHGA
jgi:Holliday junction resolvase RusA-like endonuclease